MDTHETFCGLLAHTDPQKVSELQGERNASSAQEEAQKTRCRKGAALKSRLEASEWPVSEPCELPCQDRSRRALSLRAPFLWRGWGTSTPTLSAPQWLMSSSTPVGKRRSARSVYAHAYGARSRPPKIA